MVKQGSAKHSIQYSWCKGCGICVHFCPKKVLELDSGGRVRAVRPEDCIGCRLCQLRCPDLAIEVLTGDSRDKQEGGNEQ
ncbi:MAG: 4Fe-4S binding protein [Desulfosalsimonas sp.]